MITTTTPDPRRMPHTVVFATSAGPGVSWQIDADATVRGNLVSRGTLPGTTDGTMPRAIDNGDGTVKIYNRAAGKLLAVENQYPTDGALVRQYFDAGSPDQSWSLVDAGGGWSKIVNFHSRKVLAVSGQSTADGAQVVQWTDNGTADHLWQLV
jgi:hypothetical protein